MEKLLSDAEKSFFRLLQDDLTKTADIEDPEKLSPAARLLLGVSEEDKSYLQDLNQRAAEYDEELRSPEEADEDLHTDANEETFGDVEQVDEKQAPPQVDEEPAEEQQLEAAPEEVPQVIDDQMVDEELPPEPEPGPQPKPEPAPPGREDFGNLFSNRRAHPIVIAEVLRGRYDDDWVTWAPETLWWVIRRDFGRVGELAREKIMALRVALQTGFPWTDWDVFENCGQAWNDHMPIFGAYQPMPPSEAAFTVQVLKKLHPEFEFENEVNAYLGAICEDAGYVMAPPAWFPGVQKLINRKDWIAPLRTDVKEAWANVRKIPGEQILKIEFDSTNPLDIHMGKLIAVREYLAAREVERKNQFGRQVRNVAEPSMA